MKRRLEEGGAAIPSARETAADRRDYPWLPSGIKARQRALKTNGWVALMFSWIAG
jgi:hypothetical protein